MGGPPVDGAAAGNLPRLEGQDAALRRERTELAAARVRYFDLFDLAPVAYVSLSATGLILEANLAAATWLGVARGALIQQPLSHFILNDDRDSYFRHREQLIEAAAPQSCELRMRHKDGALVWALLAATLVPDPAGQLHCRVVLTDITARKQLEEALRHREQLLRESQSVAGLGSYVLDIPSGAWSRSAVLDEILGIDATYAHSMQGWAPLIHPDDRAMMVAYLADEVQGQGLAFDKEYRICRHNDQATRWVHGRGKLEFDAAGRPVRMLGSIQDITGHKQTVQALHDLNQTLESRVARRTMQLRHSEARFRQLAEATFEGIGISEDGILLEGNPQLAAIHGYAPAEMIGRPLTDFVAPESLAMVATRIEAATDSTYEFVGLRKDGSRFSAESHARVGTWLGSTMRISAVRDLTTVKQAVAGLHTQQAELEHAQRLALVSEISAGIIHQLGQPLSAMAANLAVVKIGCAGSGPQCRESLDIIGDLEADVARMRNIVIHLRALANPEHPDCVGINCNEIVAEVLPLLRQKAEARQIRLDLELDDALPTVSGDVVQLSQVILNLVSNAFDASVGCAPERRGVLITTRALAGEGVELSVRDTGSGIAPEVMARLFTPFFSTKAEGLGVGLRLSRTIVEAHRGSIQGCNNADGIGATFRVRLPATLA
jgi:PAS domain S-box-containing protein